MAGITINSNIASMQTQRRLGESSATLNKVFERLSSGQRINRASDDAAGLAISDSLRADKRVYSQGIRNLNDGLSMLSIGEGALGELSNIVIRIQELSEQAANGTFSNRQRGALDAEAQALAKEYQRIAQTTQYNGLKLFDGSVQGLSLQGGYGATGSIQSSLGGKMGTGAMGTATDYTTGTNPIYSALGDLNSDGFLDIAVSNSAAASISVLLGNGDGSFKAKTDYTTGGNGYTVALGDLNGDGILDVVNSNVSGASVSILIGNGDGSFKAKADISVGTNPTAAMLGDFNSDGILDIVSSNSIASTASVMLGNGNGTFKSKFDYTTATNPQSIAVADYNGDGNLDLAFAAWNGGLASVLLGNGDGSFGAKNDFTAGANTRAITAGDLNSDGIVDLVTVNWGAASASVLLGNGNGTFKAKTDLVTGSNPSGVALGDLNSDGFLDIITANTANSYVSALLGNGNGSFSAKTDFATSSGTFGVSVGDFNSDGVQDIVADLGTASGVSVLIGASRDGVAPLLPFSLKTQTDAKWALTQMSNALVRVSSHRGQLGSFQSRLNSAINNSSITVENYAAAESQIRDTDVAMDAALLVKNKILQQAGASILAQSNREPEIALLLLT